MVSAKIRKDIQSDENAPTQRKGDNTEFVNDDSARVRDCVPNVGTFVGDRLFNACRVHSSTQSRRAVDTVIDGEMSTRRRRVSFVEQRVALGEQLDVVGRLLLRLSCRRHMSIRVDTSVINIDHRRLLVVCLVE